MKLIFAAALLTLPLGLCATAQEPKPDQPPAPAAAPQPAQPQAGGDFTGKVLAISTKNANAPGGLMEKVQVRTLGGRPFLVGESADERMPRGAKIWIPVEDVIQVVEFKSLEEARQVFRGGP